MVFVKIFVLDCDVGLAYIVREFIERNWGSVAIGKDLEKKLVISVKDSGGCSKGVGLAESSGGG
jgi:hypothetical protein